MQRLPKAQAAGMFCPGDERCEECAREPLPATAIHPRTNEPPPPAVVIANNVVARPREAWAHHVLRLIGAL
jgi:hypothetical protein